MAEGLVFTGPFLSMGTKLPRMATNAGPLISEPRALTVQDRVTTRNGPLVLTMPAP